MLSSPATPWLLPGILGDFRSALPSIPNLQDGWNRQGLIDENGARQQAFSVLSDFYARPAAETTAR
jgi:beta-glucuronidase